ncbi:hypothetical protein BDR22DRAFT_822765 [Usnea florida]
MDVFSATLCSAQALAYVLSVIKSLTECHLALRHGCEFLCDQQASVGHLLEVLIQLKHRTRLDPPLRSLLESIDTTVRDILLLVKQRKRRQLLILLVIRRTEVNESFALLERKKSTLNLYLTTENSFAIASLKTAILRHSTRDLEMADSRQNHLEDSSYGSGSEALQFVTIDNLAPGSAHQTLSATTRQEIEVPHQGIESHNNAHQCSLASRPQSSDLTTSTYFTAANIASGTSHQTLYAATGEEIDVKHVGNESHGSARQCIGSLESAPSRPLRKRLGDLKFGKKKLHTRDNQALNEATQKIYVPEQQTMDIIHVQNLSKDHAVQLIGKDPHVPQVKIRILGVY